MKKYVSVLILFFSLALLCACGAARGEETVTQVPTPEMTASPEPVYSQETVSFSAAKGENYSATNGYIAEYGGVRYEFANSVSKAERDAAVYSTEEIFECIRSRFGELPFDIKVCVWGYDYPARVAPGEATLHIGGDTVGTLDHIIGTVQTVFGVETNYGLCYATGCDIAEELGYELPVPQAALNDALSICDEAPEYLDLNYACFIEPYADAETQEKLKVIALAFYDWLDEENRRDLTANYSEEKYCTLLSAFLTENGKGAYDNSDLCGTLFYNGGEQMLVVWENEYAVFYVRSDFVETYASRIPGANMVTSSYPNLRRIAEDSIPQAEYMEQVLGRFDTENGRADVVFMVKPYYATKGAAAESYYRHSFEQIQMYCTNAFMHEYGHYLIRNTDMDDVWREELLCHYYSTQSEEGYIRIMIEASGIDDDPLIAAAGEHLGHALDLYDEEDYWYYMRSGVVSYGNDKSNLYDSFSSLFKSGFMKYLVDMAGETAAVDAVVYDTPEETFGKNWDELADDWLEYIYEEYAWVAESGY